MMTRIARALVWLAAAAALTACDYGRMREDEAVQTFKTRMPIMPARTIPGAGGIELLRQADPNRLTNPVPNTPESVAEGKQRYVYYCVQCHGPAADGNGTVGQSFAPLPADLGSPAVQQQSDGMLFAKMSLGYLRHPPLWYTVAEEHRWALVNYIRALKKQ
jgi:mono/diheme cytochrome c family protein